MSLSTLQRNAPHCNTLQNTATRCYTLQHTLYGQAISLLGSSCITATHCSTLQYATTHCNTLQHTATHCNALLVDTPYREVGGWGRDPKKCTGRGWGMGSSTIEWALRPVVKYHLRRGVGLIDFLKMVLDPRPPPLAISLMWTSHVLDMNESCDWAMSINILQHTATHCNILQHAATHCNTLPMDKPYLSFERVMLLQHILTHCNTLQHTATHCNTLAWTSHTSPDRVKCWVWLRDMKKKKMSPLWMSHVNKSCVVCEWVTFCVWGYFFSDMNKSYFAYERVMSRISIRRVPHMNESRLAYECAVSCIWMSHVPHVNASCSSCK